ncbi:sorbosone dehydrogenase family protein [Zoogloea sp.]|uniref:PQQ-dependent sugar dehydrogenase n=1 Tax=Zoogloea sp. TaxID=49181 RepID=UPI0035B14283
MIGERFRTGALLCALAVTAPHAAGKGDGYATSGDCGGLPAVPLKVAKGFCVGLAATKLGFPRGVLPLADGRVLVADLGRWDAPRGRLLQLTPRPGGFDVKPLLTGLDRPHGLQAGPDGAVYIGEAGRISRVRLDRSPPVLEPLIVKLPATGRHPLKQFVFGPDGAIYANIGSTTDHCEDGPAGHPCPEAERPDAGAAIWRYKLEDGRWTATVFARGLRNSMALAFGPDGSLWQAENSRDWLPGNRDSDTRPPDELNRIRPGQHYGWPYCTGLDAFDPAFGSGDCRRYAKPERLLPAHAAPLGMTFYDSPGAPAPWRGSLVIALHGYRKLGHRIVAYRFDKSGQPARNFEVLVEGWQADTSHPMGAPTDIKADRHGRLWVTEDRNGTLLAVASR